MYEFKLELSGMPDKIVRNLSKQDVSARIVHEIEKWLKISGQTVKPVSMEDDGPAMIDLYQDGRLVGRVAGIPQPAPARPLTGKFKDLQRVIRKTLTTEVLIKDVSDVIIEVIEGKWPNHEKVSAFLTVGELRNAPGFWVSTQIIHEMLSAYAGRSFRKAAMFCGLNPSDPDVLQRALPILDSTNGIERAAIVPIQDMMLRKYGHISEEARAKVSELNQELYKRILQVEGK